MSVRASRSLDPGGDPADASSGDVDGGGIDLAVVEQAATAPDLVGVQRVKQVVGVLAVIGPFGVSELCQTVLALVADVVTVDCLVADDEPDQVAVLVSLPRDDQYMGR